jgi:hypothetical protein
MDLDLFLVVLGLLVFDDGDECQDKIAMIFSWQVYAVLCLEIVVGLCVGESKWLFAG